MVKCWYIEAKNNFSICFHVSRMILYSVSPSPKKGHGKVAKKGHFERAATCQKGTFSVRRQAKGHFFKWPISCYEGTFKYRSLNLTLNI